MKVFIWIILIGGFFGSTKVNADQISKVELNLIISEAKLVKTSACFGGNVIDYINLARAYAIIEIDSSILFVDLLSKWGRSSDVNIIQANALETEEEYKAVWAQIRTWENGEKLTIVFGNLLKRLKLLHPKNLEGVYEKARLDLCNISSENNIPGLLIRSSNPDEWFKEEQALRKKRLVLVPEPKCVVVPKLLAISENPEGNEFLAKGCNFHY